MSKKVILLSVEDLKSDINFSFVVGYMNMGYQYIFDRFQDLKGVSVSERDSLFYEGCNDLRRHIWNERDKLDFMYFGLKILTKENYDKFVEVYRELLKQFEKECIYAQVEACEAL